MSNRRYGMWSGCPGGVPENKDRCVKEVWPTTGSMVSHQCRRPRGHGENGEYCSSHARGTEKIKPFRDYTVHRKS